MVRELTSSERCATTVTDQFRKELENLVDEHDRPCEFEVTIEVRSPGHGDKIAMDLCSQIRLGAYDAMDEFDERLSDSRTETDENGSKPEGRNE